MHRFNARSLWSLWELQPQWITKVSDMEAFQMSAHMQELLDSLDHTVSAQFCWSISTTFTQKSVLRIVTGSFIGVSLFRNEDAWFEDWNPDQPRDDHGRWTSGGSGRPEF